MSTPTEPAGSLDWWMDERRSELGMRWVDVAKEAGITAQGLRDIRKSGSMRRPTRVALERALQWTRGSIDEILRGGEPEPIGPSRDEWAPRDELERRLQAIPGLTQKNYRELVDLHRRASDVEDAALAHSSGVHPDSPEGGNETDTV